MNNATINIDVYIFEWTYVFISLEYMPKCGIAESYGNPIFNLWRNSHIVF